MAEMSKIGEMYAGLARDAYKPVETAFTTKVSWTAPARFDLVHRKDPEFVPRVFFFAVSPTAISSMLWSTGSAHLLLLA